MLDLTEYMDRTIEELAVDCILAVMIIMEVENEKD